MEQGNFYVLRWRQTGANANARAPARPHARTRARTRAAHPRAPERRADAQQFDAVSEWTRADA